MSELATLIVDGDPADWLPPEPYFEHSHWEFTVRIDALPIVTYVERAFDGLNSIVTRPLRVDDRVTLATIEVEQDETSGGQWPLGPVPFATATVAKVLDPEYKARHGLSDVLVPGYHVTVTDVKAL